MWPSCEPAGVVTQCTLAYILSWLLYQPLGVADLTQPSPSSDSANKYTDEYYCPAWLGLSPVLPLMLISKSCNLIGEFTKFSYQTTSQSWIFHDLLMNTSGYLAQHDTAHLQS